MSVNYSVPTINNRLQQVVSALDAGAGNGVLRLLDGGNNVLSTLPLAKPSGTVANGAISFNGLSLIDPAAAFGGAIVGARCEDSTGNVVISGLTAGVAGSGSDIIVSPSNVIAAGQTVAMTAATITGR